MLCKMARQWRTGLCEPDESECEVCKLTHLMSVVAVGRLIVSAHPYNVHHAALPDFHAAAAACRSNAESKRCHAPSHWCPLPLSHSPPAAF